MVNKKTKKLIESKINYQKYKLSNLNGSNKKMEISLEKRNASSLPSKYFQKLLNSVVKIEKKYKIPMDIEWAIEGGYLYITQARPITALTK